MHDNSMIKTPDQRLRVFVSSTVHELADERRAATDAIKALRLSPVLFELGARPHAPREVYRAYLAQSHIFIGIYWESYGWVAPDMDASGIEDELILADEMPKLIYIKRPAPNREARLEQMLQRFRSGDSVSYRSFGTAEELGDLIKDDLIVMLTERFEQNEPQPPLPARDAPVSGVPSLVNEFVGREREMSTLVAMLQRDEVRLVTLTGPGGIGKSRLALEAGAALKERFHAGVHLVALESVTDPSLVLSSIASTIEVGDTLNMFGDSLIQYLRDKQMLLILDNLEQVLPATADLVRLLEECPGLKLLVTSRVVLKVRGEHEFRVPILDLPQENECDLGAVGNYGAVQLFVSRVRAVDPTFELTKENGAAVAAICRKLDGLPLALELAAARTRLFPPELLLRRLDNRFSILTGGAIDLPERHRALRTTIAWSFDLLGPAERDLLVRFAVFRGGWTLEAAEAICGGEGRDVVNGTQALLESSLIRLTTDDAGPRFTMLETIRDFAARLFREAELSAELEEAHARFFLDLVETAGDGLRTGDQARWLARLEADHDNIRAAFGWAMAHEDAECVAEAGWSIWMFWWIRAHLDEGLLCMNVCLQRSDQLSREARAHAAAVAGVMHFWKADFGQAAPLIAPALEEFRELGDKTGIALCQLALGFIEASLSDPTTAFARFDEARELFESQNDLWGRTLSLNAICWLGLSLDVAEIPEDYFRQAVSFARQIGVDADLAMAVGNLGRRHLFHGEFDIAEDLMLQALRIFAANSIQSSASYITDAFAELAILRGEYREARRLFGAGEALRRASRFPLLPFLQTRWERWTDRLEDEIGPEAFEAEFNEGLYMTLEQVMAYVDRKRVDT